MIKTILFLIICLFSITCSAQFQPNVKLKQNYISNLTSIDVGINLENRPCWIPSQSSPNYGFFNNGNQLELVVVAFGSVLCNPIPVDEPIYHYYNIGELEEGIYNIQIRVVGNSSLILPFTNDGVLYGNIQDFKVNATFTVPILNKFTLLVLLMLFLVFYRFNNKVKFINLPQNHN